MAGGGFSIAKVSQSAMHHSVWQASVENVRVCNLLVGWLSGILGTVSILSALVVKQLGPNYQLKSSIASKVVVWQVVICLFHVDSYFNWSGRLYHKSAVVISYCL